MPTGPTDVTPLIQFLFVIPQFALKGPTVGALGFLQTFPRGFALALSLTFGSANTWYRDFHPTSLVPCLAHTLIFSGGLCVAKRRKGRPVEALQGRNELECIVMRQWHLLQPLLL